MLWLLRSAAGIWPAIMFTALSVIEADIVFIKEPEDQAIIFGQDLFLHCAAINDTTGTSDGLNMQWRLNGSPVTMKASMFSNFTLLVPRVGDTDLGNYSCVALDDQETVLLESASAVVSPAFIKMFEIQPRPWTALEDESVSFDCITGESAPPPVIYWERNGEPFYDGRQVNATFGEPHSPSIVGQYSMKLILTAKPHLDGIYNCVARNPVLKIYVRSVGVKLQTSEREVPPYVVEDEAITGFTTPLDQPMVLACPVIGKPNVRISWFKDGLSIDNFDSFLVLQNGSLYNPHTRLEDEGLYYCEGENLLGYARSPNMTIIIARLEFDFLQSPEDMYLIAGLPATMSCIPPISVPPAYVTWYKDGALLVPRTGEQSLRIVQNPSGSWDIEFGEVQKHDEGEYFCVANNDYAVPSTRTSTVAMLTVGGAPIFIEPPTGLTINKGELARLVCYVQGDPFPIVTWLVEDIILKPTESVSFREQNQELWIGNIHKGFEGTYTCRASNRYGTTETSAYVKVHVPPVIMVPVGHILATANEAIVLPCTVYSDPPPLVTWYKDGAALAMAGRFTQLQDGLYIASVHPDDTGTYICEATNSAGTVESNGTLSIQVTPHFITRPEDQEVIIGRNTTLTCSANGYPKPSISWLFNGSSLFPQDSLLSLNHESLFLLGVSWLHVGVYTCKAENSEGVESALATVKLQIPPKVKRIEGVPVLYQEEDLNLKCHVTGIPSPMIEWQKNREPVKATQNGRISFPDEKSLRIMFVTVEDTGLYTCKVTNPAGVSQKDIQVHIIVRPSAPVLHQAETTSATSVELAWSIDQEQPQTPVDHVLIYYRKKTEPILQEHHREIPSGTLQYELNYLDPATEYVFMVAAVNEAGESDISNILAAKTFDAGPSEPRNFQAIAVTADSITLEWEIPFTTNGEIRHYKILYSEKDSLLDETDITIRSSGSASETKEIEGLKSYTWYSFRIQGATMEGDNVLWGNWSATIEVKTQQSAPTGSPREIKAVALSPNMVHVTWEAVHQDEQNGPIKRYHVSYWLLSNMTLPLGEEIVESLDLRLNISGLEPWTWYSVVIYAENDGGDGVHSSHITVRTMPTAPSGAPINVSVEALSSTSLRVMWMPPPEEDWHSDLSGYIVEYWKQSENKSTSVRVEGHTQLSFDISGLEFWSEYEMRVAAYTDQVVDGVGPYSENVTGKTMESAPDIVMDLTFTAAMTSIVLSWKPPEVTNGNIKEYLITYFSMGSAVETSPSPFEDSATMLNYSSVILNDSYIMAEIFSHIKSDLSLDSLETIMDMCIYVFSNETVQEHLTADENFNKSDTVFQSFNLSAIFVDWFMNENQTVIEFCDTLKAAAEQIAQEDEMAATPAPVILIQQTSDTQIELTDLSDQHIYNISVMAATAAGYGQPVFIHVTTLKATTTKKPPTTKAPIVTTTTRERVTALDQSEDNSRNMPMIIGGAVGGLVLLLLIFVLFVCAFIRRWRADNEEKVRVISTRTQAYDDMYGQLDRPGSSQIVSAAEDGTDTNSRLSESVDIYGSAARFHSPDRSLRQASHSSFMTEQSGVPAGTSHNRQEALLGMDNPSYNGLDPPGTVKRNPTYLESPSASDMESMSVTMTLSAEDLISQGDSTLKRKSRMKSRDAAAIARLRSSHNPTMSEQDTSSLIHNEVEVVYNERTAL